MRRTLGATNAKGRRSDAPASLGSALALVDLWRDTATPVLMIDGKGLVTFANRSFQERMGRRESEMLGRPAPELFITLEAAIPGSDLPMPDPITGRRLRLVRLNPRGNTPSTALCASQPLDDRSGRPLATLLLFSRGEPNHAELAALVGTLGADLRTAARALRGPEHPHIGPAPRMRAAGMSAASSALSVREREVMGLLVSGRMPQTIAEELAISPNTVRNHVRAIYRKLGVRSQLELLARVWERP